MVTRNSPTSGRAESSDDAAPISHAPAAPASPGPSSISCPARRSRAERRNAGLATYQSSIRSSIRFQTAGKPSTSSGSRWDHWRSSMVSCASKTATPPPATSSSAVVTSPAAKDRLTFILRRSRCTAGSSMELRASASRKGSSGASSHLKKTTAPPIQSREVIVFCKKTLSCDI